MSMIFNPKYRDMPSQVQKNKNDIEMLKTRLKNVYYTTDFKDDDSETMTIFVSHTNFPLLDFSDPEVVAEFIPSAYIITGNSYLMKVTSISYNPTVQTSVAIAELVCDIQGADGEPGRDGQNATSLSLGSVTEGDEASATLTPTGDGVYTLDLVLPRGEQGEPGEPGEDGERGPAGPQGPKGDDAVSLSIGTITNVPYGDPASATLTSDGDGNYTLDMEIPEGPAPDLSPGLVDSLPYGYEPTINITYDGTGYVLDMGIPEGAPGQNGQDGTDGVDGTNAEIVGVSATVDNNTGVPYVDVYNQGTSEQADFVFEFHNLKGESGGGNNAEIKSILPRNKLWLSTPWNNYNTIYGGNVWSDGENIYYSFDDKQYMLDKSQMDWIPVTWTGLTNFRGVYIWTDFENVYHTVDHTSYILVDPINRIWQQTTFNNAFESGNYVWCNGYELLYSYQGTNLRLNPLTGDWTAKTWTGLTTFTGDNVWSDGLNIYCSNGTNQHILNPQTSTWTQYTWSGSFTQVYGAAIWSDGENFYYSATSSQYMLNKATNEWVVNPNPSFAQSSIEGYYVWTDGNYMYYSNGSSKQYKMIPTPVKTKLNLR